MTRHRLITVGTAFILLGACSSTTDPAGDGSAADQSEQDRSETSSDQEASNDEQRPSSPLAEYLGEGINDPSGGIAISATDEGNDAEHQRQARRVEELVAECMREQGFEYVPREPSDNADSEFNAAFSLSPEEFAREYGYGVSTLGELDPSSEDETPDANEEIREGLSAQAREAYDRARWGDLPAGGTGTVITRGDDEAGESGELSLDQGCHGEATREVFGEPSGEVSDFERFEPLFEDLAALSQRIQNDPRLDEPRQLWADCIAAAGFPDFDRPEDAHSAVLDRMNEITGGEPAEAEQAEAEGIAVFAEPETLDPEKLAEVRDYEIDVATADYECRQDGYAEAYRTVQFEHEQEFVDQHRDELEQYREAFAGSNG